MSISLTEQLWAFGGALCVGAAFGLLYDLLRLLRTGPAASPLGEWLADLLFWLVVTGTVLYCASALEDGKVRIYMAAANFLGAAAYFLLLSPWVRKVLGAVVRFLALVLGILFRPVVLFVRILTDALRLFCNLMKFFWKNIKTIFPFFAHWYRIILSTHTAGSAVRQGNDENGGGCHVQNKKGWSSD